MYLRNDTFLQGGKYRILRHISSGGFGNTYEGIHTVFENRVAIKEFFPKMFCNRDENTSHITVATSGNKELVDKLRKKFVEEAKAIFKMTHPNIVKVHDIFDENSTAYYVMDYIDGQSLGDIVNDRGAMPETEALDYIRQVADALKYVHSLNRLHLDIKPGNVMVSKNGHATLIDFGASKHYDSTSGDNTSTLMGVNTRGYAPVEQTTQGFTKFSPATDIYALGATLYKLLSGITPPDATLLMAKEATILPLPDGITTVTSNAVRKAMSLIRADRPQSIDAFVALLDNNEEINVEQEDTTIIENKNKETRKAIEQKRNNSEAGKIEKARYVSKQERKVEEAHNANDQKLKAEVVSNKKGGNKLRKWIIAASISVAITIAVTIEMKYNLIFLHKVVIPDGVERIKANAYEDCNFLTSVSIPNSVTNIGDKAFYSCGSLSSIEIPNSVTSIGEQAFSWCTSLTSLEIPNSVTNIGNWAVASCSALTSVVIGNSVTSIGEFTFSGCTSLTSVVIGNSVTSIGERAFYECESLTSIDIPNSVKNIEARAFECCPSLYSVLIPNSVTSIGENAFMHCTSLSSVVIGNSVTSIGEGAFWDCKDLSSVVIGNSVTNIKKMAFFECKYLTSIEIPYSVKIIGDRVFEDCTSLTSVTYNGVDYTCRDTLYQALWDNGVTIGKDVFNRTKLKFSE